jgi:hypothetical protein
MHIDDFRAAQRHGASQALTSLLNACRRKFLNAARLLELGGTVIQQVEAHGRESVNLWPLMNMYSVACERYCEEFFTPQIEIFSSPVDAQDVKWSRYFHHVLVPHLLQDDAFVRNVLRATMSLPSKNAHGAGEALVQHLIEMSLPSTCPLWAPENEIDW